MELISVKLPSWAGIFKKPLIDTISLFGFAKNRAEAMDRIEKGFIKVNREVTTIDYHLKVGDLLTLEGDFWGRTSEYGIVFEEQP